jgi:hypothetical protein
MIDVLEKCRRTAHDAPNRAGVPLNQRCNQTQEFLLLWSATGPNEKGADLNIGHLPARRKIGLVPHESPAAIGIDGEQPPIAVGTDVNGSGPNGHAKFYSSCSTLALAHIYGEGPPKNRGVCGARPGKRASLG